MKRGIVFITFILAGLVAVVTLVACNRIQQLSDPNYEFVTLSGERKRGWCDTKLEVPKCKSEFGNWYEVKQFERIR